MPRKITENDLRLLAKAIAGGRSCREVATALGVSPATAIRWTRRSGLVSLRATRLAPEVRNGLRAALDDGASPATAAARFGVSLRTALRHRDPALAAQRRRRVIADVAAGASLAEAAERAGVSPSTAARWTHGTERGAHRRALRREEDRAVAAMEAGMSMADAAKSFALDEAALVKLARRSRLSPERLARRERVFQAIAAGLSCRKAAALVDVPVATAIRWARAGGGAGEIREQRGRVDEA